MAQNLEPDTEQLLYLARQGEPDALGLLLNQYRGYLQLLARLQVHRRLQAKADASDVVQEAFLEAHRDFSQFRGVTENELLAWLRQILASCVAGLVRKYYGTRKRDPQLERDISDELDRSSQTLDRSLAANLTSPSRTAVRHEQAARLATALEKLPPDYREVIILHHQQVLSFPDVAKQMERTDEAARKLWIRALGQLRKSLGDQT